MINSCFRSSIVALALAPIPVGAQVAQPSVSASVQSPASPVAPAKPSFVVGQPNAQVLRAGTAVPLRTLEELTTKGKRLKPGQRFNLETTEPVRLSNQTVIPAGSPAVGEVTSVRNKGMWGKSGNIEARVLYLRANGQQVRLSGSINDKGVTGTAGVVGAIALVPIAGFFTTGTSAVIANNTPVAAFLDEDLPIVFAEGAGPQPMTVPAAMPSAAPQATSGASIAPALIPAVVSSTK